MLAVLSDPSGMLSRTEAELLDRQLRSKLNGHNATGCVCPGRRDVLPPLQRAPPSCSAAFKRRNNSLRLAVVLVPSLSVEEVEHCSRRMHSGAPLHSFPGAALAFGEWLVGMWSTAHVEQNTIDETPSNVPCDVDLFLLYVQNWMPHNLRRPFVVRIFR